MKIMVVDDDPDFGVLLTAYLEKIGHTTLFVQHSLEALDVQLEEKPDLILMDIIMPDLDGIEAAREILDMDPAAKIIFVTALGDYPEHTPEELRSRVPLLAKPLRLDRSLFARVCASSHFPKASSRWTSRSQSGDPRYTAQ